MGRYFIPDEYKNSIYEIDSAYLKDKGMDSAIVDIDNTLSGWGSAEPGPDACRWIDSIRKEGFKVCILSNSSNRRVNKYCKNLDVLYVKNVRKPFKSSFLKAVKIMKSDINKTCVIGDQVFTDILGGNLCGMYTILVAPIDKKELIFTQITRKIEKLVIRKSLEK